MTDKGLTTIVLFFRRDVSARLQNICRTIGVKTASLLASKRQIIATSLNQRFGFREMNDHIQRGYLGDAVFDEGDDGFDFPKGVVQRPLGFNVDVNLEFHVSASFHDAVVL